MMWRDRRGFTGLEAAIVLIAFVVVAAVFSYVMLGAGFFTTQKSQEVVHTGVKQASSSVELSGDVVAQGGANNQLQYVKFYLQLTAGATPVDKSKIAYVLTAENNNTVTIYKDSDAQVTTKWYNALESPADNLLEPGEKLEVTIDVSALTIEPNERFTIEIKPPVGAVLTISRKAPADIVQGKWYTLY